MYEIRTKRLILRPSEPRDLDAMHEIFCDFDVVRNLSSWPWPPDKSFTATRCEPIPLEKGIGGSIFRHDGTYVGGMAITDGSLGYGFGQPHWGLGYATEIAQAVIGAYFDRFDADQITAEIWVDNAASHRVLTKLGFDETGETIELCKSRGEMVGGITFCLPRARWESLSNPAR